jgi:hypothetical protein
MMGKIVTVRKENNTLFFLFLFFLWTRRMLISFYLSFSFPKRKRRNQYFKSVMHILYASALVLTAAYVIWICRIWRNRVQLMASHFQSRNQSSCIVRHSSIINLRAHDIQWQRRLCHALPFFSTTHPLCLSWKEKREELPEKDDGMSLILIQ